MIARVRIGRWMGVLLVLASPVSLTACQDEAAPAQEPRPSPNGIAVTTLGIAAAAMWPVYPVLCLTALACGGAVGAVTIALQRHVGRAARSGRRVRGVARAE